MPQPVIFSGEIDREKSMLQVVHLSDIHVKSETGNLVQLAESIGRLVRSRSTEEVKQRVLLLAGDIAFSAVSTEFERAEEFLLALLESIDDPVDQVPISILAVPGNHDINFDEQLENIQGVALPTLKTWKEWPMDRFPRPLLAGLTNYFAFCKRNNIVSPDEERPFFASHVVNLGENSVEFHLLNSTWSSAKREPDHGSLIMHPDLLPEPTPQTENKLSVAVLHHPPHWALQSHLHAFQARLSALASVVITGHEHTANEREVSDRSGRRLEIAGGCLIDHNDKNDSSFNILSIDPARQHVQITSFEFNEQSSCYEQRESRELDLASNASGRRDSPSPELLKVLDDLGENVRHPRKVDVGMRDIFVEPFVMKVDLVGGMAPQRVGKILRRISQNELDLVVICGSDKTGKSCLARHMCSNLNSDSSSCLLLSGADLPRSGKAEGMRQKLDRVISTQLIDSSFDTLIQRVDKENRYIVIDDADQIARGPGSKPHSDALEFLVNHFGGVILTTRDPNYAEDLWTDSQRAEDFAPSVYRLAQFGHQLRKELVSKWMQLESDPEADEQSGYPADAEELCNQIEQSLKAKLVPCLPIYVIVLLQELYDRHPSKHMNATISQLYDALLTRHLSQKEVPGLDLLATKTLLGRFAFTRYSAKSAIMPDAEFRQWYNDEMEEFDFDASPNDFLEVLVKLNVLKETDGAISFRYKYNYSFFLASHLADQIAGGSGHDRDEAVKIVETLANRLHHGESADVMVLLASLVNSDIVLDSVMEASKTLFSEVSPADLTMEEVSFLKISELKRLPLPDQDSKAEDRRMERRRQRDAEESPPDDDSADGSKLTFDGAEDPDNERAKYVIEINAAFRTINVLGQVLRNNAASRSKEDKREAIGQSMALSRRILGHYLDLFRDNQEEIIQNLSDKFREDDEDISAADLLIEIAEWVNGMYFLLGFSLIRRASCPFAHPILSKSFKQSIDAANPKSPIARLMTLAHGLAGKPDITKHIKLIETIREENRGNGYVLNILRMLVADHLYLFDYRQTVRQQVCAAADIEMTALMIDKSAKS